MLFLLPDINLHIIHFYMSKSCPYLCSLDFSLITLIQHPVSLVSKPPDKTHIAPGVYHIYYFLCIPFTMLLGYECPSTKNNSFLTLSLTKIYLVFP